MRRTSIFLLLTAGLGLGLALPADALEGRIVKVLPQFLDLKGRNSLAPSLYERDAYQVYLRDHPDKRSGLRFQVQWKAKGRPAGPLKVRVELRGTTEGNRPREMSLEQPAVKTRSWLGHWTLVDLTGDNYKKFGAVTAWRVTFWEGETLLGERRSFLW